MKKQANSDQKNQMLSGESGIQNCIHYIIRIKIILKNHCMLREDQKEKSLKC